jgi:hypothetical protein
MTKYQDHRDDQLPLQAKIICLLLFIVGVAMILQHPAWFR